MEHYGDGNVLRTLRLSLGRCRIAVQEQREEEGGKQLCITRRGEQDTHVNLLYTRIGRSYRDTDSLRVYSLYMRIIISARSQVLHHTYVCFSASGNSSYLTRPKRSIIFFMPVSSFMNNRIGQQNCGPKQLSVKVGREVYLLSLELFLDQSENVKSWVIARVCLKSAW